MDHRALGLTVEGEDPLVTGGWTFGPEVNEGGCGRWSVGDRDCPRCVVTAASCYSGQGDDTQARGENGERTADPSGCAGRDRG